VWGSHELHVLCKFLGHTHTHAEKKVKKKWLNEIFEKKKQICHTFFDCAIHFSHRKLFFSLRGQLIPSWGQAFAMSTPGSIANKIRVFFVDERGEKNVVFFVRE